MGEDGIRSHRDLAVWRKAMDLARDIYHLTDGLPKKEEYRMTAQLIRAAISIPANIAEGNARGSRKDYAYFISVARGSTAELETLLTLVTETELAPRARVDGLVVRTDEVGRMLTGLKRSLDQPKSLIPNP
jgi:four helix bundle protein